MDHGAAGDLCHARSARQYLADHDHRFARRQNALDHTSRGDLLWSEGSYPVAGVIFLASIMVPTLKMIAIAWLCWDAKGHGKRDSERMHLIYEVVEFVGRWSMIDVFVIAVLSALVRMGG